MSEQVLHLDFIRLTPGTDSDDRGQLNAAAAQLRAIDGVIGVGAIESAGASDFDVAFWFLLRDFAALEPFGTDPRYSRFLQGTVAPMLTGFAGADVTLEEDFAFIEGEAACLALMGPDETYDFEIRDALAAWAEAAGATSAAIGLTVGERGMYRGAAIAFSVASILKPEIAPFRTSLIQGAARALA